MAFIAETINFKASYLDKLPSESKHVTIYYGENLNHFGHAWIMAKDWPKVGGKWMFNRGDVPILNDYMPEQYCHDTLEQMLDYLENDYKMFLMNKKDGIEFVD